MTAKTRKRLTESDLLIRLAKKHPAPAWAFLTQVRNGTGYGRRVRTADALAMSLWPSRGLELHGFEVKSQRGDWIHELKTPEKAEEIARFCHRWWIVAEDDVVEAAEIPPAWGLMVPHGSGLAIQKLADLQDAEVPTYPFLGALLRKVSESMVPFESIKSELDGARKSGYESAKAEVKFAKDDLARLQKSVTEFEAASGVKIPPLRRCRQHRRGRSIRRAVRARRDRPPSQVESNPPGDADRRDGRGHRRVRGGQMTANQAVEIILDPKTLEDTRQHLRGRVYGVFDEMFEEATGKRTRLNQGVWDALKRWKEGKGGVAGGREVSTD